MPYSGNIFDVIVAFFGNINCKKYDRVEWDQVEILSKTDRGEGGFGSTGTK